MEPITAIANTIAGVIFGEALKEGGKALGKGASEKVTQLISAIRDKFKTAGTEGLLARAQKQPTERNIEIVEGELVTQMEEDEVFAKKLAELVEQLKSVGVINSEHSVSGNVQTGASFKDVQFTGGDSSHFNVGNATQNN